MNRALFASAALAVLLSSGAARAGSNLPPVNIPTLADWEQLVLQNLTGPTGVPVALGAPPTPTGSCSISTQVGGQATGSFKASGACSGGTIIFTFASPAPNGFECGAKDITTTSDTLLETATTTTAVTFTGTLANNDIVLFGCRAF